MYIALMSVRSTNSSLARVEQSEKKKRKLKCYYSLLMYQHFTFPASKENLKTMISEHGCIKNICENHGTCIGNYEEKKLFSSVYPHEKCEKVSLSLKSNKAAS